MTRDIADLQTTVSTRGATPVSEAFAEAAACADPATCGSEWAAGHDIGSPTIAVLCTRCGRTGSLDVETSAELRAAVLTAGTQA
ncbi:hypothetical protein [Methylorubrum sp. DB1722]|uniref:hypothetical protein n=1 Tax=Methylorubrum sp. DB1722 TaxID=2478916 RepID=UPI0018E396E9|nr:hypothetical protein [Methylorubrum sp. DB1722]MBI1689516.1 hypothetical protein [Methylorubrum sp. DB1722]